MLEITQISQSFGTQHVLENLDLSISSGAMTALIGPNGCGKSTLFNIITGEISPNSGDIFFQGQSLIGMKPRKIANKGIIRKFQIPGIYPSMRVSEHLKLPFVISNHKRKFDKGLMIQTAKKMGLVDIMDYQASVLSTGQKQWLEMAMLILLKPTLLLLDEPISGMTATEALVTCELLKDLNKEGLTIVTIEHNIDFVKKLTNDIVVLMDGRVAMRSDYEQIAKDAYIKEHYLGSLYA